MEHSTQSRQFDGLTPNQSVHTSSQCGIAEAHWAGLSISIPNDRSGEALCAFVEAVLVELTHEPVGAVRHPGAPANAERLEFVCLDDVGEQFELRQFIPRHGWAIETMSRTIAREKLLTILSRDEAKSVVLDSFSVIRESRLQSRCVDLPR